MKILLVNCDAPYNLAINKLKTYYKNEDVITVNCGFNYYNDSESRFIDTKPYDKVYISMIFENSQKKIKTSTTDNIDYGGIGSINPNNQLPKDIDNCEPYHDNIYYNYITRGCIRKCYFCKVWSNEGYIHLNKHPKDMNLTHKNEFLDNNILAYDDHLSILKWLNDNDIRYRFMQGLDFRLTKPSNLKMLSDSKYIGEYIFAYDDISYKPMLDNKIKDILDFMPQPYKTKWYVYTNINMPVEDYLTRIEYLVNRQCLPYIMRDKNCFDKSDKANLLTDLSAYFNQPYNKKRTFEQFLIKRHTKESRINKSLELVKGYDIDFK